MFALRRSQTSYRNFSAGHSALRALQASDGGSLGHYRLGLRLVSSVDNGRPNPMFTIQASAYQYFLFRYIGTRQQAARDSRLLALLCAILFYSMHSDVTYESNEIRTLVGCFKFKQMFHLR